MDNRKNITPEQLRLAASGKLLGRLIHDLKQPLNLIRVNAQDQRLDVKKDRLDTEMLTSCLLEIEGTVDILAEKISQLRAFAEQTGEKKQGETFELNELCRNVLGQVGPQYPALSIQTSYSTEPLPITGDGFELEHALWELIQNRIQSAQSTTQQKAEVKIVTQKRENDAVILIKDNGPGISSDIQKKIFEPFVSTKTDTTGLGLSLVNAIVKGAGGSSKVIRSGHSGSLFEIEVPLSTKH